jgi:hypothetical protein
VNGLSGEDEDAGLSERGLGLSAACGLTFLALNEN